MERTLDRSKKIDFEMHIYHCPDCQEDLGTFQEVMLNLSQKIEDVLVPSDFMENINKDRLAEKEKHRQQKNKKRKRIGLAFAGVVAVLISIGFFTGTFANVYYAWTEEDQQLSAFLQQGLGERLNLEAESNGIKIKIMSVIADDIQTLVFYEIEDTVNDNQYLMDYYESVSVEDKHKVMNREINPRYYEPDLKSDLNNKKKNVFRGKLGLPPLAKDNDTIKLKVTKLHKLNRESSEPYWAYNTIGYETGEWEFEIPVTKHPSIEYALDKRAEIEGVAVRFDKLIFAPTTTLLQWSYDYEYPGRRINGLNFDHLKVNNKIVQADMSGNISLYQGFHQNVFQTDFDPLVAEKPKEVSVQLNSVYLWVDEQKSFELDASDTYPQIFEYAGSRLSIDKVEIGQHTKVVISNDENVNRAFDRILFDILAEDENEVIYLGVNYEGMIVDKNGNKYGMDIDPVIYEEIEQPRYLFTVVNIELYSNDPEENVIPKTLKIFGYDTTKYLDDVVSISLK